MADDVRESVATGQGIHKTADAVLEGGVIGCGAEKRVYADIGYAWTV